MNFPSSVEILMPDGKKISFLFVCTVEVVENKTADFHFSVISEDFLMYSLPSYFIIHPVPKTMTSRDSLVL